MTVAALDAPAHEAVGRERLAVATFVVVALAFSRVSESLEATTGLIPISSAVAVGVAAVALWSRAERRRPRPMVAVAVVVAAGYLTVAAFSAIGARDPARSFESMNGLVWSTALCVAVVVLVSNPRRLDRALSAIVVATLVVSSVSCLQVITGSYESTFLGLARSELAAVATQEGWRLGGPVGDPNFFAQALAVGVAVSVVRLIAARHVGRGGRLPLAAAVTGMVALFLTYSRGGLLAFGAAMLVCSLRWLGWRSVVVAVGVGAVLLTLAPDAGVGRLRTAVEAAPTALAGQPVADSAINGRASEAIVGYRTFSDHWFLGVGVGNYEAHYLDYAADVGLDVRGEARSAHSIVVETLAETGVVGLAVLGLVVLLSFAAIGSLRGACEHGADDPLWWCALAVEAALIAHLVTALFLHSAYPRGLWLVLGLALACGQVRPSAIARQDVAVG